MPGRSKSRPSHSSDVRSRSFSFGGDSLPSLRDNALSPVSPGGFLEGSVERECDEHEGAGLGRGFFLGLLKLLASQLE